MKRLLLAAALCLALATAGCGDDDTSGDSVSATRAGESAPKANEQAPATTDSSSAQSSADAAKRGKPKVSVPQGAEPKGLVEKDLIEGSGPAAEAGDEVTVHYVGVNYESGEQFDASWDRNEPFSFTLGRGEVIPGWDQGIEGMKAGGQRELVIPPGLAYGATGAPPAIGPNETLVFVVDLLAAK